MSAGVAVVAQKQGEAAEYRIQDRTSDLGHVAAH